MAAGNRDQVNPTAFVAIQNLDKSFGNQKILKSITESFAEAKISVLLGPSGCGKTTTLRCIAGLERPSAGRVLLAGRTVYQDAPPIWVPPERRQVSMVFQSYAIWPHMTVSENVSLPLRAAGVPASKRVRDVGAALEMVGLHAFADRSVTQLSGGQQQRVALARCIVSESPVILMDEPLSNLDAKLRVAMRIEIRQLQRRLGRTILFVTHDQEEAMSIADRVYLYSEGTVIQNGPPKELYDNPATRYTAEFLGRANIISVFEWGMSQHGPEFRLPGGVVLPAAVDAPPAAGSMLCIRPEKWRLISPQAPGAILGRISDTTFVGDRTEYGIDTSFGHLIAVELNADVREPGDNVGLAIASREIKILAE